MNEIFRSGPVAFVLTPYLPLHLHAGCWQQSWYGRESVLDTKRLSVYVVVSPLCVYVCVWVCAMKWQCSDNSLKSIKEYVNAMHCIQRWNIPGFGIPSLYQHLLSPPCSRSTMFPFQKVLNVQFLKWTSPTHHWTRQMKTILGIFKNSLIAIYAFH